MPYDLNSNPPWCECPCCGLSARGNDEIEELFGWRTMANGDVIPQSYCRGCRSAHCTAGAPCRK